MIAMEMTGPAVKNSLHDPHVEQRQQRSAVPPSSVVFECPRRLSTRLPKLCFSTAAKQRMSAPRLTADLLAVHDSATRGYASELESDAGSMMGDVAPTPAAAASSSHDPYQRSSGTFRGALAALGASVNPTRPRGPPIPRPRGHQPFGSGFATMNAFERHKLLAAEYLKYYGGKSTDFKATVATKTDADVLKESYRFVRSSEDDAVAASGNAEQRLAKKYYDRLFREYALADMTHYRTGRIGLRWRTENEVIAGRGQFSCGNKHCTSGSTDLKSFELHFAYSEAGVQKQTLVKVRLCKDCAYLLHYPKLKEMEAQEKQRRREKKAAKKAKSKKKKKQEKSSKRQKRKRSDGSTSSSSSDDSSDSDVEEAKTNNDEGRVQAKKPRIEQPSNSDASSSAPEFAVPQLPAHAAARATAPSSSAASAASPAAPSSSSVDVVDDFFQRYLPQMFP